MPVPANYVKQSDLNFGGPPKYGGSLAYTPPLTLTHTDLTGSITLPPGAVVMGYRGVVREVFDGTPTLNVGTVADPDAFIDDYTPTALALFKDGGHATLPGVNLMNDPSPLPLQIDFAITATDPTTGELVVSIAYILIEP